MHDTSEDEQMYEEAATERHALTNAAVRRPIKDLPYGRPLAVPAGSTVAQAVQAMVAEGGGCCLVTRPDGSIAGILSERDVMKKVVARGQSPANVKVDAIMTPNPDCLSVEDPIGFAVNRMALGGFRHIPVLDKGKPVGLLSVRTILRDLAEYFPEDVMNLPPSPGADIGREREGA